MLDPWLIEGVPRVGLIRVLLGLEDIAVQNGFDGVHDVFEHEHDRSDLFRIHGFVLVHVHDAQNNIDPIQHEILVLECED